MKRLYAILLIIIAMFLSLSACTLFHEHTYTSTIVAPKCYELGYTVYTCSGCHDSYRDNYVDPKHNYTPTIKPPTCTQEGYTLYICSYCGDEKFDNPVPAGHSFASVITAPTCTEGGYTTHTCSVCGFSYVDNKVDLRGHRYSDSVVTEPTRYEGGYTTYICADCGHSIVKNHTDPLGASGTCGDNLTWELDEYGVLVISGTGYMTYFEAYNTTWEKVLPRVKKVIINEGANGISSALSNCTGITSITIPNSVIDIESGAFRNCTGLSSITLSNRITSIWDCTFCGCTGLTSIKIPNSVERIGDSAFADCTGLEVITISNNVRYIGVSAFSGCTNLRKITIPDSISSVEPFAFDGCSNLEFNEFDNACYLGNDRNPYLVLVKAKAKDITSCAFPNGVKIICANAFQHCSKITSITIPDGVQDIGWEAFADCDVLSYISFPDSVIGFELTPDSDYFYPVFVGCPNLHEIHYRGTMAQWKSIYNSELVTAWGYAVSCTDGEINP